MAEDRGRTRWGAALMFALAVANPSAALADDAAPACQLDERFAPRRSMIYPAVMLGMAPFAEVARQTLIAIARSHAPQSPAYVSLPRIMAAYIVAGGRHETIAAVMDGKIPRVGDRIRLESRHRDSTRPCSFVPWTVVPAGQDVMNEARRGDRRNPSGSTMLW